MLTKITVCSSCKHKWNPYHDSGSILCSGCECETHSTEITRKEYITCWFETKADKLYYSLPEQGEEFMPNLVFREDPLSYFSDEIHKILKNILKELE